MAQTNQRMPERDRKQEGPKRDAASSALREPVNSRESRFANDRERTSRPLELNRIYQNDLYERSSF